MKVNGRIRVTVNEKILVHLMDYARFADRPDAPREVTQQGLADALRVRRSHVTIALQTLASRGMLLGRTARIVGGTRRKKAYFLSPYGYERARETRDRLVAMPILLEGEETPIALGTASERLGGRYALKDLLPGLRPDGVLDPRALASPDG